MLDLVLAILHHLIIFALFGVLVGEMVLVKPSMNDITLARIARLDTAYGGLAMLVVIIGFSRAIFAAKGWAYYSHNGFFWAKVGTFLAIALLSIPPTLAFIKARRSGLALNDAQVAWVRRFLRTEAALFSLLLIFAAAMARGYGEFG